MGKRGPRRNGGGASAHRPVPATARKQPGQTDYFYVRWHRGEQPRDSTAPVDLHHHHRNAGTRLCVAHPLPASEHHAVHYTVQFMENHARCKVHYLAVDGQGRIRDKEHVRRILESERGMGLVSLAYVNNEIGTILDVGTIGARG